MTPNRLLFSVLALLLLAFASCTREIPNSTDPGGDEKTAFTQEHVRLELMFHDVFRLVEYGSDTTGAKFSALINSNNGKTPIITADNTTAQNTLTIDFGADGITSTDGVTRSGRIMIQFVGAFRDSNAIYNVSFDNFKSNGFQLFGAVSIANKGRNDDGFVHFAAQINGGYAPAGTSDSIFINYTRDVVKKAGWDNDDPKDDQNLISGLGKFRNMQGNKINNTISIPLLITTDCRNIRQGEFILSPESGNDRRLNFGDGVCDENAQLTVYGTVYYITIQP